MTNSSKAIDKPPVLSTRGGRVLALIALLAYAFAFQGSRGLWEPDEGRYTNVALMMIRLHDWLGPKLHSEVPHFTKPPLTYWAIAASIELFGKNEWAARLPYALAFASTVLLVYGIGRRLLPEKPWLPALIYATSPFVYGAANIVTTDTLLTLWETLAVFWFIQGWITPDNAQRRAWRIGMWAGFGLAFLTKGPPGLLPLAAIVAFAALRDGWAGVRRLLSLVSFCVFVATALGWYLAAIAAYPELLRHFQKTLVGEMLTGHWERNAGFVRMFTTYLPPLILGALPWLVLALPSAPSWIRAARALPGGRAALRAQPHTLFLLFWVAIPLGAFCAAQTRLPLYVLPLFVPISLLLAKGMGERFEWKGWTRAWVAGWIVILIGGRWAASVYPSDRDARELAQLLAERTPSPPKEFVFVDAKPFYGLSLYCDAEVETLSIRTPGDLPDEMKEVERDRLFAVHPKKVDRFERKMAEIGPPVQALGEIWDLRLYWLPQARLNPTATDSAPAKRGQCLLVPKRVQPSQAPSRLSHTPPPPHAPSDPTTGTANDRPTCPNTPPLPSPESVAAPGPFAFVPSAPRVERFVFGIKSACRIACSRIGRLVNLQEAMMGRVNSRRAQTAPRRR